MKKTPTIAVGPEVWTAIEVLGRVGTSLGRANHQLDVVLFGGLGAALRTGRVGWKLDCDIDLLIDVANNELRARVHELVGDGSDVRLAPYKAKNYNPFGITYTWFDMVNGETIDFFPTGASPHAPLTEEKTALREWIFRSATPLHVTSETPNGYVTEATVQVGAAGPLLFGKLVGWATEMDLTSTPANSMRDIAALVSVGAIPSALQMLNSGARQGAERTGVLTQTLRQFASLACPPLLRAKDKVLVEIEGDRATSSEIGKAVEEIERLPAQLDRVGERASHGRFRLPGGLFS